MIFHNHFRFNFLICYLGEHKPESTLIHGDLWNGTTLTCSADVSDNDGETPAHAAAAFGKTETLQLLLAKKADLLDSKDNKGRTPAHVAAQTGKTETLQMLLAKKSELLEGPGPLRATGGPRPLRSPASL